MEEGYEPKKLALLRILEILKKYSDIDHPLKQVDILERLQNDYGIVLERKSVGRNLALLKDAGYEIEQVKEGSYLQQREFEDSELQVLIDAVLSCSHMTVSQTKEMIKKISALSNCYFKPRSTNIYSVDKWSKTMNPDVFFIIENINEAIAKKKKVQIRYNKYGIDHKLHNSSHPRVTPYQTILHNQRYYLMAYNDFVYMDRKPKMMFYRLDRITEIKILDDNAIPIREVPGYENGIDYTRISKEMPYLYTDEPKDIKLKINSKIVDQTIDWFGTNTEFEEIPGDDKHFYVTIKASPSAMRFWILQYIDDVEVIAPIEMKENIINTLKEAVEKYE